MLSGRSAAQVHGLDLIESELPVEVTVPRSRSLARPDLVVRRAELAVDDRTMVAGLPVTSVLRTIMDVARHATLDEAVVVADSALRMGVLSRHQLAQAVDATAGPRARRIRRALLLVDESSGSALETRARVLMHLAALPAPVPQLVIRDEKGQFVARVDFAFVAARVVVELDGFAFHRDRDSYRTDRAKANELARLGWRLVRLTWEDVVLRPDWVIELLRDLGV